MPHIAYSIFCLIAQVHFHSARVCIAYIYSYQTRNKNHIKKTKKEKHFYMSNQMKCCIIEIEKKERIQNIKYNKKIKCRKIVQSESK